MSGDDTKQVQDALQAIKKLVEMSEEQMSPSDDVVMLDNVVWRNPVKDEAEELSQDSSENVSRAQTPVGKGSGHRQLPSLDMASEAYDSTGVAPDEGETSAQSHAPSSIRSSSIAISPRDLEELSAKPVGAAKAPQAPHHAPSQSVPPSTSPLPQTPLVAEAENEITDLTSPLGRRGGGFYDTDIPSALRARPAIQTSARKREPTIEPPFTSQNSGLSQKGASTPVIQTSPVQRAPQVPKVAIKTSPVPVEPAITDFHGADFNFSAQEGLMTAASFRDLAERQTGPIVPEVNVPLAQPAVSDPASEAQAMFEASPAFEDDNDDTPPAYPNLHIVSDQGAVADGGGEEEEEGFSGAVRLALRSIIKEQVSTWLQGNMTGLIEEALTTPQKRPTSGAKTGKKKR